MPNNLTLTAISILLVLSSLFNQLMGQNQKENSLLELERILKIDVNFQRDTLALIRRLDSVKKIADERRSIPLKWAYYMLMADGFSIAFDNVNIRSNFYFQQAHNLVSMGNDQDLFHVGLIRQGYYYFVYRKIREAFPYFLQADDLRPSINLNKIPRLTLHYGFIARFYSYIGDQKKAIEFLELVLPFTEPLSRNRIDMVNALGVYSKKDSSYSKATDYFNKALHIAGLARDSVWIGIISGNLADLYWKEGRRSHAIDLVKKNIEYSLKFNESLDAMRANLTLARMYVEDDDLIEAENYVNEAIKLMENKPYFLEYQVDACLMLAKVAKGKGDLNKELDYLRSYLVLKDSLDKNDDYEKLHRASWKWETEKYHKNLENYELKRKQTNQTYIYFVIFFVLFFLIIILLVNRSKNKILFKNAELEKDQLELSYEKQMLDRELLILNNSLEDFTATIKQNDLTIQRLRNEVMYNLDHFPDRQEEVNDRLNKMLENHVMTEERWVKFSNIFERVYPGYVDTQKELYPRLTENDCRLLSLMKLGLNNRSIAELMGISLEGVKKAKQRLKKKLE